jgi:signal transduction histidine kinase
MVEASFVGVGIFPPTNKGIIHLTSNLPQVGADAPRSWQLDLVEWPPFRAAIRKRGGVELLPDGQGGRHLRVLYEAMEVGPFGSMLVEPMFVADEPVGMLLLAKGAQRQADDQTAVPARWSAREKAIAPALAAFAGQALTNSFRASSQERLTAVPAPITPGNEIPTGSGYLIALEAERNKLAAELDTTTNRAAQAETRAIVAMKRAHDLAQTLEEMERIQRDERIEMMEREIDTLRESLAEAEDAMAMAAAGESGLSTEWVMLTITRYSGQLEEAQARIELLESELSRQESGMANELLVALIQELRTPMTSISGFTDLLLGETMGILGTRQRDLVQRVQANSRRMGSLLDQMLQLVANREQATPVYEETVDVQDVIETAVTSMMPQIREKNCRLDMEIADDLPALTVKQNDLQQIVTHLLGNACQAAGNNGRVTIIAQANTVQSPTHADGPLSFLQITVSDSGNGILPADLPRVFDARHRADAPLIKGLGDTGAGLSVAHDLAQANGGRIWVNSQLGVGSTFSLLFPLVGDDGSGTAVPPSNGAVKYDE